MKENYNFPPRAPRAILCIFTLLALLFLAPLTATAQQLVIVPEGNPQPQRWQPATFKFTIYNVSVTTDHFYISANEFTITPTPGYAISTDGTPPKITDMGPKTIPTTAFEDILIGDSLVFEILVTPTCLAPQSGGFLTYTYRYFNFGTTGDRWLTATNMTAPISVTEYNFLIDVPKDTIMDKVSGKIHERIWELYSTAPNTTATNLRITHICDGSPANFEILEAWVVDADGNELFMMTEKHFIKETGKYTYYFDEEVFAEYGNGDEFFDTHERVYIKEKYLVKTCVPSLSTYGIEYGDGITWCSSPNYGVVSTRVVDPGPLPTLSVVSSVFPHEKVEGTNTAEASAIVSFFSRDLNPKNILRNIYFTTTYNLNRLYVGQPKDAYFVTSAGEPIDVPGLVPSGSGTSFVYNLIDPDDVRWRDNLGLICDDEDGLFNDLPYNRTVYIKFEYTIDFDKHDPTNICPDRLFYDRPRCYIYYRDNCNVLQNSTDFNVHTAVLGYQKPVNAVLSNPNVYPAKDPKEADGDDPGEPGRDGTRTTLTFTQPTLANTAGYPLKATSPSNPPTAPEYEHYIIVSLPLGFEYDPIILINNTPPFDPPFFTAITIDNTVDLPFRPTPDDVKILPTLDEKGRQQIEIRSRINVQPATSTMAYSIPMIATTELSNSLDKNFKVAHEWTFLDDEDRYRYACYEVLLNYQYTESTGCLSFDNFDVVRQTFGWTDYLKGTRITKKDIFEDGMYPKVKLDVAGPYDNIKAHGEFKLNCDLCDSDPGDVIVPDCEQYKMRWMVELEHKLPSPTLNTTAGALEDGTLFIFPNPAHAAEVKVVNRSKDPKYGPIKDTFILTADDIMKWRRSAGKMENGITDAFIQVFAVDITPYTFQYGKTDDAGNSTQILQVEDSVVVTFFMQTTQNMPVTHSLIYDFTMRTYLAWSDKNTDPPRPPHDPPTTNSPYSDTIAYMKNFWVIDYAVRSRIRHNRDYNENRNETITSSTQTQQMSSDFIFPHEYRPHQYGFNYEYIFNQLWFIASASTTEINHTMLAGSSYENGTYGNNHPVSGTSLTLTPNEEYTNNTYWVSHEDGKTKVKIYKELQANTSRNNQYHIQWHINGYPYCADPAPTYTATATYFYYPSSEIVSDSTIVGDKIVRTYMLNDKPFTDSYPIANVQWEDWSLNGNVFNTRNKYTTTLTPINAEENFDIIDQTATLKFRLTNTSAWSPQNTTAGTIAGGTDRTLPFSWLMVTIPDHVKPNTISLTDGVNTWSPFMKCELSDNKYWINMCHGQDDPDLAKMTLPGPTNTKDFWITMESDCENYQIDLEFGQSRLSWPSYPSLNQYPDKDPDNGISRPCPNTSKLTLYAQPPVSDLRFVTYDAPFTTESGSHKTYQFCKEHRFGATFFNPEKTPLFKQKLELELGKGLELSDVVLWWGSDSLVEKIGTGPGDYTVVDPGSHTDRTATITVVNDEIILEPYQGYRTYDTLSVTFNLKPVCDFNSGYIVYMNSYATTLCGDFLQEVKHTVPIKITGVDPLAGYIVKDFDITSNKGVEQALDLLNQEDAEGAFVLLTAGIQMETVQALGSDYIAVVIPSNMTFTPLDTIYTNNILEEGIPKTVIDTLKWRVEPYAGGQFLWKAVLPNLENYPDIKIMAWAELRPTSPWLWSCEPANVTLFTGSQQEMDCFDDDGNPVKCNINITHENQQTKPIEIHKNVIKFKSAHAEGIVHSNTEEEVTISGVLSIPDVANVKDLVIDVYNRGTDTYITSFTIPAIETTIPDAEWPFEFDPIIVPALDMCWLQLKIRKTNEQNQYLCDEDTIRIPTPNFEFVNETFTICVDTYEEIALREVIDGYTYVWGHSDNIIVRNTVGDTLTVNYGIAGTFDLGVEVVRGACAYLTHIEIIVRGKDIPDFTEQNIRTNLCIGDVVNLPDLDDNGIEGHWEHPRGTTVTAINTTAAGGPHTYTFIPDAGQCADTLRISVTINPDNTATSTNANRTLCIGSALDLTPGGNIIFDINNTALIPSPAPLNNFGLPAGVTATVIYNTRRISISGTPTESGIFNYSIPLTGGCGTVAATGTIIVNPYNSAGDPSTTTVCTNLPVTIKIPTTGATGIGTPDITGGFDIALAPTVEFNADTIYIAVTPTTGSIVYSIPLTGGCGTISAQGTITIVETGATTWIRDTVLCLNVPIATPITLHNTTALRTISSGQGSLPPGVTAAITDDHLVISGRPTTAGTYSYSLVLAGNCGGATATGEIIVNPTPTVDTIGNQALCNGAPTTGITFSSTPANGETYNWVMSHAIGYATTSGVGNIPSFAAVNTGTSPITSTITVTPKIGNCEGTARTFTITVYPTPAVTNPGTQTICNGVMTSAINFSGTPTGVTYAWVNTNPAIGLAADGNGGIPAFSATNTSNAPISGEITVTPSANGCVGTPATFTITINPTPIVDSIGNQALCTGTSTAAINFTGNMASGVTYNWTNSHPAIGLATPGSGDIASFPTTNTTAAPVVATIRVTPTANACTGTSREFTIMVNPTPTVDTIGNQTVCNGAPTTAINFSGNITNPDSITYTWTNSAPTIGLAAGGTGSIDAFTAVNTGTEPITATIRVTPTYGALECAGAWREFTITVNPSPKVDTIGNQTVCHNTTTTAVEFEGNVAGGTYRWANSNPAIGLGATGVTNSIPAFTALNSTTAAISGTIRVTPLYGTCEGTWREFTITVNPMPTVAAIGNQALCAGASTTAITFTSTTTPADSVTYTWTNDEPTIGLAASGTGNIAAFTTVNAGTTPITATIRVTPKYGALACAGEWREFTITVNPTTPAIFAAYDTVVCGGATKTYTVPAGFTNYNWLVLGGTTTAGGNPTDNTITITWDGPSPHIVTVGFVGGSCLSATSARADIEVISGGAPTFATYKEIVCNDDEETYTVLPAGLAYTWAVTGGTVTGGGTSTNNTITVLWDTPGTGTIDVEVTSSDGPCFSDPTAAATVTINLCKLIDCGDKDEYEDECEIGYYTATAAWDITPLAGATFSSVKYLINDVDVGITTLAGVQFPVGTTKVKGIASSDALGLIDTCDFDVEITDLGYKPTLSTPLHLEPICSGEGVAYIPTSATAGTAFEWMRPAIQGILPVGGTRGPLVDGVIIEFLENTTSNPITVTYQIFLSKDACDNMQEVKVVVNPQRTPIIAITEPDAVCEGESITLTATATNGGDSPNYEWSINGDPVQTGPSNRYTYFPTDGDEVTCTLTTSLTCVTSAEATSNTVTVTMVEYPTAPELIVTLPPDTLSAFTGMPVDLSKAVDIVPDLTYTYYTNADKTGRLTGSVVTFNPPKNDYYVTASNGGCEGPATKIILKDPCPPDAEDFEGNPYNVTSLAGLCWTANLKSLLDCEGNEIAFAKSYTCTGCPDDLADTYGRLYDWYSAVATDVEDCICPEGYRLPTKEEWSRLEKYAASSLRSNGYWIDPPGFGSDDFGFDARPGGWYNGAVNRFEDLWGFAGWWSSDDIPETTTANYSTIYYYCEKIMHEIKSKGNGLSVRCVWIGE